LPSRFVIQNLSVRQQPAAADKDAGGKSGGSRNIRGDRLREKIYFPLIA
jgi:hypothetical protein